MGVEEQLFPQIEICKTEDGRPVLLGRGGFSTVYEVKRRKASGHRTAHYAMKVIGGEKRSVPPELFRETVRLQWLLGEQCPYVVRILETAESTDAENGNCPIQGIVMERLLPVLDRNKYGKVSVNVPGLMEEKEVLRLALQIGQALQIAHANNILHRDIKLENIFWDEMTQSYKLGDFGLAKYVEDGKAETVAYTDGYGAPEISRRLCDSYGATADIYSFGISLYLLLNDLCFPGSVGYYANEVQYHADFVFPAPKHASLEMAAVLQKMCSYHREDRYQSMTEVLAALQWVRDTQERIGEETLCGEELPDLATATYQSEESRKMDSEGEKIAEGKTGRKEILRIRRENAAYQREQSLLYVAKLTPLFFLVLVALMGNDTDERYLRLWILPVAVGVEAVLQKLREVDALVGAAVVAVCVYSGVTGGVTAVHVLLVLCLLSGMAEVTGAVALGTGLWFLWVCSGRFAWLGCLCQWEIAWIPAAIALVVTMDLFLFALWMGERLPSPGAVWNAVGICSGPVLVIVGTVLWLLRRFGGLVLPETLERLHLLPMGILITVGMAWHFWWNRGIYEDVYMDEG